MSPVRILLVDDSPEFLESAARFLSADPQIEIVGRALSGAEAMAQVARIHPDLVLMDWRMPGISGPEATRHLKAQPDAPSIVFLTVYDETEYRAAARSMGADGYVAKSEIGTELLPTIHTLFDELAPTVSCTHPAKPMKAGDVNTES